MSNVNLTGKQNFLQGVKFIAFSLGAGIIQTVTFTLMNEILKVPYQVSYLTALILSVLYNFTVNRRFTFKSANNIPVAMIKVALFYAVFTPLSTWIGGYCENVLHINEYIVLAVTMIINLVTEFIYCRLVVYRNSMNTNSLGVKEAKAVSTQEENKIQK